MTVTLPSDVVRNYRRFSLYNSPYRAHDRGCAIDLYPPSNAGRSPVAGVVRDTRTLGCPDRPYAVDEDHLVLVDVDGDWLAAAGVDSDEEWIARILHVNPDVEPGEYVAVGDSLGPMVRSGFFGQWVDNHVHVGFRRAEQNLYRATGSRPVDVAVDVQPLDWDGTGTVVETDETYALLDAPAHPDPDAGTFAAIATDDGVPLDGGLTHYAGGGVFGSATGPISLLGERIGVAGGRGVEQEDVGRENRRRRTVEWADVDVLANGKRITGLSLFAAQDSAFGAKLVCRNVEFEPGDDVRVSLRASENPIRLGVGR